jgi:hypothetical protein
LEIGEGVGERKKLNDGTEVILRKIGAYSKEDLRRMFYLGVSARDISWEMQGESSERRRLWKFEVQSRAQVERDGLSDFCGIPSSFNDGGESSGPARDNPCKTPHLAGLHV